MSFIEEISKSPSKSIPTIPGVEFNVPFVINGTSGDVGIELEMEGQRLAAGAGLGSLVSPSGASWTLHNDGSLRNGGVEYVLTKPCMIDEVSPLCEELFDYIHKQGGVIEHSNRTSTHVHINVNGMKVSELTSLICLWGLFEPALIYHCGEQRRSNHFCLSNSDTRWLPDEWRRALKNGGFHWDNTYKYSALNLGSFTTFGSFEIRCMGGAENAKEVTDWARMVWALREYAKEVLPDTIGYATSERSPTGILEDICDRYSLDIGKSLLEMPDFDRVCLDNFRDYQGIAFMFPWTDLREEINKKHVNNPFGNKKKTKDRWADVPTPVEIEQAFFPGDPRDPLVIGGPAGVRGFRVNTIRPN